MKLIRVGTIPFAISSLLMFACGKIVVTDPTAPPKAEKSEVLPAKNTSVASDASSAPDRGSTAADGTQLQPKAAEVKPVVPAPSAEFKSPPVDIPKPQVTLASVPVALNAFGKVDDGTSNGLVGDVYDFLGIRYEALPDFSKMTPLGKVLITQFNVGERAQELGFPGIKDNLSEFYGIVFKGQINADVSGDYKLFGACNDGCRIFIDGVKVLDFDGLHGAFPEKEGQFFNLGIGWHDFKLEYYQGDRPYIGLMISWLKPGSTMRAIIPEVAFRRAK